MKQDDPVEKMLTENPLIGFSVYTHIQSKTLQTLRQEIIQCFEAGMYTLSGDGETPCVDGELVNRAYGLFWLWVLGAFEIVRTMCQAEQCFSSRVIGDLKDIKRRLALLRMPFAKQELAGKSVPVGAEPSIYRIVGSPPDFWYQVSGQEFSVRQLLDEFAIVLSKINRSDVLANHRTSYAQPTSCN